MCPRRRKLPGLSHVHMRKIPGLWIRPAACLFFRIFFGYIAPVGAALCGRPAGAIQTVPFVLSYFPILLRHAISASDRSIGSPAAPLISRLRRQLPPGGSLLPPSFKQLWYILECQLTLSEEANPYCHAEQIEASCEAAVQQASIDMRCAKILPRFTRQDDTGLTLAMDAFRVLIGSKVCLHCLPCIMSVRGGHLSATACPPPPHAEAPASAYVCFMCASAIA